VTFDEGQTVVGAIELEAEKPGPIPSAPATYSATFNGRLILRMQ
jgi:hypothetical protein